MKRQQETVGSIVQIHINDEFYVYAQILPHGLLAFFDYKSDTELSDLNVLKNAKVLFITAVYKYVITKGKEYGSKLARSLFAKICRFYLYDLFMIGLVKNFSPATLKQARLLLPQLMLLKN